MLVQPVAKVHIASTWLLSAVESSLRIQPKLLQLAERHIGMIYPLKFDDGDSSFERWSEVRQLAVALIEEGIVSQYDVDAGN